ncbi:hypothetical protein IC235_10425 [Hymenobacter sp. BT664]|uniref:Uncharacterized protein n=1 Tax=Hymenobacter montanus TaxID=2771359 RepID=A0A927GJB1_9BACT|nr:hypothetical protein [Hymenobacter montanus]MBD2768308.1 hypothetical protein [Hymenobacter montanus]
MAKVGQAYFFLKFDALYANGESEEEDFDALEKRHHLKPISDIAEIKDETPTSFFKSLSYAKHPVGKHAHQIWQASQSQANPIVGMTLHGYGGFRVQEYQYQDLLQFINKPVARKAQLSLDDIRMSGASKNYEEYQLPHDLPAGKVKEAGDYLETKGGTVETRGLYALALSILHDALIFGMKEFDICESDMSFSQPLYFSRVAPVPEPRFAINGFYQTPSGWVL